MIRVGRDLGDRLVPTHNRCGIFIIIATSLSQNNTGNFPKHKPELTKNSQEIPVSVSEAPTTSPKHTTSLNLEGFYGQFIYSSKQQ